MDTLVDFLNDALSARRWSMRELARQAGISHSTVSQVISAGARASPNFCVAVAGALGEKPDKLLRLAGFLPPQPGPVDGEQDALSTFRQISMAYRDLALRVLQAFADTPPHPAWADVLRRMRPGESIVVRDWSDGPLIRLIQLLDRLSDEEIEFLLHLVESMENRNSGKPEREGERKELVNR